MKVVTARIEEECFEDLKMIEQDEHTERAEVVRKFLAKSIKEWKTEKALKLLKERRVTIRKAAALAGVPYTEIFDLASKAEVDVGYTLKDLHQDLNK